MSGDADLASVGRLLADRTRSTILLVLLSGLPARASALAEAAGVSRSLASSHLRKLVDGNLLTVETTGRQRLYRLARQPVGDAIEAVMLLAPASAGPSSLRAVGRRVALNRARLCYDHLAGELGVAISDALVVSGFLRAYEHDFAPTPAADEGFAHVGIHLAELHEGGRPLTRACLDWSEGRHHLAGTLGAALTATAIQLKWLATSEASRIVRLTPTGHRALHAWLGFDARAV